MEHIAAIAATIAMHTGVAAWAMQPSLPVAVPQQVMQVSMVAPSSVEHGSEAIQDNIDTAPRKPLQENAVKVERKKEKQASRKPEHDQREMSRRQHTSGPQSADATDIASAYSEPVFNAAYLQNPPPVYPPPAKRSGLQGKVLLAVNVTPGGEAGNVSVAGSSGYALLDRAALDAVRRWRFIPAKQGGTIVEARVLVPVEFKLN